MAFMVTSEPLLRVGSAIVCWHELPEDTPCRVRAVSLDDLRSCGSGSVAESEICLARYRDEWYPCILLVYDADRPLWEQAIKAQRDQRFLEERGRKIAEQKRIDLAIVHTEQIIEVAQEVEIGQDDEDDRKSLVLIPRAGSTSSTDTQGRPQENSSITANSTLAAISFPHPVSTIPFSAVGLGLLPGTSSRAPISNLFRENPAPSALTVPLRLSLGREFSRSDARSSKSLIGR